MVKLGMIGLGHMARLVLNIWKESLDPKPHIVGVQVPPASLESARAYVGESVPVVDNLEDLLTLGPDVVMECATQGALRANGPEVLRRGRDLLVISNGALADEKLLDELREAARQGHARLLVPSGAGGGMDVLAAARLGGLDEVRQSLSKPPRSWKNTPAEKNINLDALTERVCIFSGSAREASALFPQNANVTATVALAGVGFDKSRVELFADPSLTGPVHVIDAKGAFGTLHFELQGVCLPDNPKTSLLAGLSLANSMLNLESWIRL